MRRHTTLEEAHPPFRRVGDNQLGAAMLRALSQAAAQNRLRIPVPEAARGELLARKKRHSFSEDG